MTETFASNLCKVNIAENANSELQFDRKVNIYKNSSFKDFENVIFVPNNFSVKILDYSLL